MTSDVGKGTVFAILLPLKAEEGLNHRDAEDAEEGKTERSRDGEIER